MPNLEKIPFAIQNDDATHRIFLISFFNIIHD